MSSVVPSQIVDLIDRAFPQPNEGVLNNTHGAILEGIVALVDQLPQELTSLNAEGYNAFIASISAVRHWCERWRMQGNTGHLGGLQGFGGQGNAIAVLRNCLMHCPDAAPAPGTVGLEFIEDAEYREQLRTDISTAYSANKNGEWKAATVIAGSVVEALLLWVLQTKIKMPVLMETASGFVKNGKPNPPDEWSLGLCIDVALKLKQIDQQTATQAGLAKHFRNLVHPGRAIRKGQLCNRATALTALAAVEHVSNALALLP